MVGRALVLQTRGSGFDPRLLHSNNRETVMTEAEKLAAYEELLRRILVHADSFGDVHWQIKLWNDQYPEILANKPYYCFVK